MDIDQVVTIIVIAGVVGALAILFLSIVDPDIRRWFRVMARRDLPSWDALLRHLEGHRFTWDGVCQTCRQAGMLDAESAFAGGQTQSQLWGSGYEAGYSDGQANRPRRGDDSIS